MKIEFKQMKLKYYLMLFFVLIYSSNLNAQNNLDKISGLSSTSASVGYSLRQLSTSYTGPLVRIKVGIVFYDVYPDATTYNFSLSSKISASISNYNDAVSAASGNALSTIITAGTTNATVAIWYDQSGYGIHVYSSAATAKIISLGSIITMNGQPTITFVANSSFTSTANVNYSAQTTATVNAVAQNINSTSDYSGIISTGANGGWGLSYNPNTNTQTASPSANYLYGYFVDGNGGLNASSLELTTAPTVITGVVNKTAQTSSIYNNSSIKNSNTSTTFKNPGNGTVDQIYVGYRGNCCITRSFLGNISETFIFNKILTTAEQTALETSQAIFLTPSVTITSSASGAICAGTNITFTAVVSNISSPTYQWYKNSAIIVGANASTYSTTSLSNNDQIQVYVNGGINNANIVSSGLKLNIDASNPASYAGTGNTWYDLSGNNNHATLMNSPTYDAASGSIVTNGSNQYISIPQISTSIKDVTMQAWVYVNLNTKGPFIKNGTAGGGYAIGIGNGAYDQVGSNVNMLVYGSPGWINTGVSYGTTGWKLVTMTMDGSSTARAYVNGSLIGTYATTPNASFTGGLNFGANIGDQSVFYNGKFAAAYFYNRALSLAEIQQNYNAFSTKTTAYSSNIITVSITGSVPIITTNGDACANKTSLTTPSGLTSYAWYKDNIAIPSATSNSYTPTTSGTYQVQVTNASCTSTSNATTIYTCGINADGKALLITNISSIISSEGGANLGTAKDLTGKMYNTTSLTTLSASSIGTTSVILGGVISATNGRTASIGVTYSTDINFGTSNSTTITSNIAAGTYTATITGLTSFTTYFAKSFIVNASGTNYGPVVNFTTASPPPPASFSFSNSNISGNMPNYYLATNNLTLSQLPTSWTIQWTYRLDETIPSADGMHWFFRNPTTTGKYSTDMHLYQINGSLQFWYNNNYTNTDPIMTGLTQGTIYKMALTYDGTNLRTYSNGSLISTKAINITVKPTNSTLVMGSNVARTLDEFRIWDSALSQAQIVANQGISVAGSIGLMLYYNFNDGTAGANNTGITSIADQSGNNRNGVFYNTALTGTVNNFVTPIVTGF
jgi:hypothetical protein